MLAKTSRIKLSNVEYLTKLILTSQVRSLSLSHVYFGSRKTLLLPCSASQMWVCVVTYTLATINVLSKIPCCSCSVPLLHAFVCCIQMRWLRWPQESSLEQTPCFNLGNIFSKFLFFGWVLVIWCFLMWLILELCFWFLCVF